MKSDYNKKVPYSLFSIRTGIGIFITTAISVYYTLFIFSTLSEKTANQSSARKAWILGIFTFFFLCLLYTLAILIYRRVFNKNPVVRILKATEQIGAGDFSVRLPVKHQKHFQNEYDVISQNINIMTEELSGMETLRQDFVSNVSHEFKAPLALMQNSCTIIMQPEISDEDRMKYAKYISDASIRMANMITNILKLSKIESQKIVTKKDIINITEHIREEILIFESVWEEKFIDIEVDADDTIEITSDRELLSLMWRNLLSNAFKFAPQNGRVSVSVKQDEKAVYVVIADNGEGIPDEKIDRIFEKFYQVDSSHATQGNGLGLALVKSISDILGYHITVGSKLGEGTRFTVKITK